MFFNGLLNQICRMFAVFAIALSLILNTAISSAIAQTAEPETFNVWVAGDAHITTDSLYGIESLKLALRQSEGYWSPFFVEEEKDGVFLPVPAINWDIMLNLGDYSSSGYFPNDEEGRMVVDQYKALTKHYREDVYSVIGNHDANYYDQGPGSWFSKWIEPLNNNDGNDNAEFSGVNPELRRFPVTGTWEHYKFEAGNVLFLMLADRNDVSNPVGRGNSEDHKFGGFPPGAVTRDTFNWWKQQVEDNPEKIIITAHHHALRGTTTTSGFDDPSIHPGDGIGGYLAYIIENENPEEFQCSVYTDPPGLEDPDYPCAEFIGLGPFEQYLEDYYQEHGKPAIDLWLAGHSHGYPGEVVNGKGMTAKRWGVTFVQTAGLTHNYAAGVPLSRWLGFTDGSQSLDIRMYIHRDPYYSYINPEVAEEEDIPLPYADVPKGAIEENGWYEQPETYTIQLRHQFEAPDPDTRPAKT